MNENLTPVNVDPTLPLTDVELDEMTMNALFGAMDDLLEDYTPGNREVDEEIMQRARVLMDTASEFYGEGARVMELINSFAVRLGEIACFHDHFNSEAASSTNDNHESHGVHGAHDGHSNDSGHSHDGEVQHRKKRKSFPKPVRMTLFDFMRQYFSRNSGTT